MSDPQTVIVLQSGIDRIHQYGDARWGIHTSISLMGWPVLIVHGNFGSTKGNTTQSAICEMLDHLGIDAPFMDTLTRGGVKGWPHSKEPLNAFEEFTEGMVYIKWKWNTIIRWLTEGWPAPDPAIDYREAIPPKWCWYDAQPRLLPIFSEYEREQLRAMAIPEEVIDGHRLMTPEEAIDSAATAISKYKTGPRNKHFRTCNQ